MPLEYLRPASGDVGFVQGENIRDPGLVGARPAAQEREMIRFRPAAVGAHHGGRDARHVETDFRECPAEQAILCS